MSNLSTIHFLTSELPEHSWPWVISALRQDQIVWKRLENPDFIKLALRKIGTIPSRWTPLNLSILDIDNEAIITDQVNSNELYPYLEKKKDQITKAIKFKSLSISFNTLFFGVYVESITSLVIALIKGQIFLLSSQNL